MVTHSKVSTFLIRVRAALKSGRVVITDYAMEGAEGLGWDESDVQRQIAELTREDFLRCEDSCSRAWEQIWVFTPFIADDDQLWIRLVERDGIVVVSFHIG